MLGDGEAEGGVIDLDVPGARRQLRRSEPSLSNAIERMRMMPGPLGPDFNRSESGSWKRPSSK